MDENNERIPDEIEDDMQGNQRALIDNVNIFENVRVENKEDNEHLINRINDFIEEEDNAVMNDLSIDDLQSLLNQMTLMRLDPVALNSVCQFCIPMLFRKMMTVAGRAWTRTQSGMNMKFWRISEGLKKKENRLVY